MLKSSEQDVKLNSLRYILRRSLEGIAPSRCIPDGNLESDPADFIDFSILIRVFNECDNIIKELVLQILEKFTIFLNIGKCFEDGKRIVKLCVDCLNSDGSESLSSTSKYRVEELLLQLLEYFA